MGDYRKTIDKRLRRVRFDFNSHNSEQKEKSLAKAAEYFGLDPKDPRQREMLLYRLADVLFGPPGKKGRPKFSRTSWGQRLRTLGEVYEKKKRDNPNLSDAKIAKLIKAEHEEFKNDDVEQIRQRLRVGVDELRSLEEYRREEHMGDPPDDWEERDDYDD